MLPSGPLVHMMQAAQHRFRDKTVFRVRRITHYELFLRLRKYSPPSSVDIDVRAFIERALTLVAVNICRIKLLSDYKMGYKSSVMSSDLGGRARTILRKTRRYG